METSQLKKYAPEARNQFAEAISSKAAIYGLMPNEIFSMKEETRLPPEIKLFITRE